MSKLGEWLSTDKRRLEFAEEELIVNVAEQIWAAMDTAHVNKSQLAERLNTSKPYVTQLLNGSRNMTLRSLADIAFHLGYAVDVSLRDRAEANLWQPMRDALLVQFNPSAVPSGAVIDINDGQWHTASLAAA